MSNTEDTKGVIRIRKSKDRQNLCVLFTDRTTTPPQPHHHHPPQCYSQSSSKSLVGDRRKQ